MSYEIIREDKETCPCGSGYIIRIIKENDWFQRKEDITIECVNCKKKYTVEKNTVRTSNNHELVSYSLVEKE